MDWPGYNDRVRRALAALRMTQADFATARGYKEYRVSRLARKPPGDFRTFKKFAEDLRVSWEWLVVGDEGQIRLQNYRPPPALTPRRVAR